MTRAFVHFVLALNLGSVLLVPAIKLSGRYPEISKAHALGHSFSACVRRTYDGAQRSALGSALNESSYSALADVYAMHEAHDSAYSPHMTSLPVYYITTGGEQNECEVAYKTFTPSLVKIEAVDPSNLQQPASNVELAHMLSHLLAIRKAYSSGDDVAMIVEDNALPLLPAWDISLEEYALSLPDRWEVSQMQWSGKELGSKLGHVADKTFEQGPRSGSAAYLIHRRGMERIMSKFMNTKMRDVYEIKAKCESMRVDTCLFGYSDETQYSNQSTRPPTQSTNVYRSVRPLFARLPMDDIGGIMKVVSHDEQKSTPMVLARIQPKRVQAKSESERVLLFFAVGSKPAAYNLLQHNVASLRREGLDPNVFLAFYSGDRREQRANLKGLKLDNTISEPGFKVKLLNRSYQEFGAAWQSKYDYIYVLDEDFNMTNFHLEAFMQLAKLSGSALVGTTYRDLSTENYYQSRSFQKPHPNCLFRYVNFVEVGAFMLHKRAWDPLFNQCEHCVHEYSMWGLDRMWCKFLATRLGGYPTEDSAIKSERKSACALIDATNMVHQSYKTLEGMGNRSDVQAERDVARHHGHLVQDGERVSVCIRRDEF